MKNQLIDKEGIILAGLTFLSFLLRLFTASTEVAYPDSCLYLSLTKSILGGKFSTDFSGGVETILPPFYPISNALLSFFVGNVELSGVLVSSIAGALLIIPVFYLAKALYNKTAAWISSAFVFLSPILIHWSSSILTESLFITLFISGITTGWYAIERRKRGLLFISGILIGLSYMTRVIGLAAIPVLCLWIVLYSVRFAKSETSRIRKISKDSVTSLTIFFMGFILVTGFYLIRLHSFYGQWTLAGSYGSIKGTISYQGAATTSGWEKLATEKAEESLYTRVLKKVIINMQNYSISLFKVLLFITVFVISGIFFRWGILYVISVIGIYFAALLVQPLSPMLDERIRYLSPILPLLLVMASGGMLRIQEWLKGAVVKKAAIAVMIGIVLLSFLPQTGMFPVQFNQFWGKGNPVNLREEVGIWMRKNLPAPVRVMSRKPYIPYYADAIWFGTPETYEEVINLAHSKGIDYIVVDRSIEFYLRPELRFLFDTTKIPADLKFVGGIRHPRTQELYIGVYRIEK